MNTNGNFNDSYADCVSTYVAVDNVLYRVFQISCLLLLRVFRHQKQEY